MPNEPMLDHDQIAASLRAQSYKQFDIVLGDDGGFEATYRTDEGYAIMSRLSHQPTPDSGEDAVERLGRIFREESRYPSGVARVSPEMGRAIARKVLAALTEKR